MALRPLALVIKANGQPLIQCTLRYRLPSYSTSSSLLSVLDSRVTVVRVFRIAQEGALSIIPFIRNRTVTGERADIVTLLQSSDIEKPPEIAVFSESLRTQLDNIQTGSIIYLYKDETSGMPVEFVGWKGKTSVRAYVPKNDRWISQLFSIYYWLINSTKCFKFALDFIISD